MQDRLNYRKAEIKGTTHEKPEFKNQQRMAREK